MAGSNKCGRQRRLEPSQGYFKDDDKWQGVVGIDFIMICECVRSCKLYPKTASRLWFYGYKKYKNGNSARRTSTQHHIRPSICYGGIDNFCSEISGKLQK